jgi:hypothetical protein
LLRVTAEEEAAVEAEEEEVWDVVVLVTEDMAAAMDEAMDEDIMVAWE